MKHKKIYNTALEFEEWFNERGSKRIPHRNHVISFLKENCNFVRVLNRGRFKTAYLIKQNKNLLVLKIGRNIEKDCGIIDRARTSGLKRYVLKYYWKTQHCMLQKYAGEQPDLNEMLHLRRIAKKKGFWDVRVQNTGRLPNGRTVIFDLSAKVKEVQEV